MPARLIILQRARPTVTARFITTCDSLRMLFVMVDNVRVCVCQRSLFTLRSRIESHVNSWRWFLLKVFYRGAYSTSRSCCLWCYRFVWCALGSLKLSDNGQNIIDTCDYNILRFRRNTNSVIPLNVVQSSRCVCTHENRKSENNRTNLFTDILWSGKFIADQLYQLKTGKCSNQIIHKEKQILLPQS